MSIIDEPVISDVNPQAQAPQPKGKVKLGFWLRVVLACILIVASGATRLWQSRRIAAVLQDGRTSPFPLNSLPMDLGTWKGTSVTLDPIIVRVSGATDLITRRYIDQKTGAALEAIVLYGPSAEVFLHRPEVCYPNAGFQPVGAGETKTIRAGNTEVPTRILVYSKGEGGQGQLQEVYYSWRYHGRWSPDLVKHKEFERIPGMFKVHVSRLITPRERRDIDNPNESFLKILIPELERRLAEATGHTPSAAEQPPKGAVR